MYALAASAAGVSLLALAPPSEADIIYTKAHAVLGASDCRDCTLFGVPQYAFGGSSGDD